MPQLTNQDVLWYVATKKLTGAHYVLNEMYIEKYEKEFERIREFDTLEEAQAAYEARLKADEAARVRERPRKNITKSKIRGDIRKGSLEEETTEDLMIPFVDEPRRTKKVAKKELTE